MISGFELYVRNGEAKV